MHRPIRRLTALLAALLIGLALAGCTITSKLPLVSGDEGATPLPDAFTYFPYESTSEGYVRSGDAPATFSREGDHYVADDIPDLRGELQIRLVPLGDNYLLAATAADAPGMIYGFASYADGVLAIYLSPDADTAAALKHEHQGAMPKSRAALSGVAVAAETNAITLASRRALDYLADMYAAGRLPMDKPSVAYIDEDPDATLPSRLVQSGPGWIKVP